MDLPANERCSAGTLGSVATMSDVAAENPTLKAREAESDECEESELDKHRYM